MPAHPSTTGAVLIRPARRDEALAVAEVHVRADRETYALIFRPQFEAVEIVASTGDAASGPAILSWSRTSSSSASPTPRRP